MEFISLLQTANPASSLVTLGMLVMMFAIMYFLIIRPQKKEQKKLQEMVNALKKGDKVVTISGVYGTVSSLKESTIILKVDENCKIEVSRNAIGTVLTDKAKSADNVANEKKE